MKFVIKHEIRGRIRIHIIQKKMSCREADILQYYLSSQEFVTSVKIQERLQDAAICYKGERKVLIEFLRKFEY